MLDIDAVRTQFPALALEDDGRARIYFDNPAGTQVPVSVIERTAECLIRANANLGGPFVTSVAAGKVVEDARVAMADMLNARSPREIIFGQNMTSLTFHVSRSLGRWLRPGDEILLSRMDHDANVTPWRLLARDCGLEIKWLNFDTDRYEFDLAMLDGQLSERTRLICVGYASNVLGTVNDVRTFAERARAVGALLYVDAVHQAPHGLIDVPALGCDFLACSSYKFFGPHQGILWGRAELLEQLEPYKLRPAPDRPPGCFETGTLSHEGLAGVTAAVDYLAALANGEAGRPAGGRRARLARSMAAIGAYEQQLTRRLLDGLGALAGVRIHGITARDGLTRRAPTVSFTVEGVHPATLAERLAAHNIFTWSGDSYAVEPIAALGLTESGGVLRVGLVHYNTAPEIDRFLDALEPAIRKGG